MPVLLLKSTLLKKFKAYFKAKLEDNRIKNLIDDKPIG